MMRKFKELRQTISEQISGQGGISFGFQRNRVGPMDYVPNVDSNQNLSQLHAAQIDRINTYLGALSAKAYVNPNDAMREAHAKLGIVGIVFDLNPSDDLRRPGERCYPIRLFGGSFGADGTTYGYKPMDDNVERRLGYSLGLHVISIPSSDGGTNLKAQIVKM